MIRATTAHGAIHNHARGYLCNRATKRRQAVEHEVFDGLAPFAFTLTPDQAASANSFGSGRTITVVATGVISSAGMPTRWACFRIASGLTAW